MKFIFADDSKQQNPTRDQIGPLVAIGGYIIEDKYVRPAENAIDAICKKAGFPPGDEFKWSPERGTWMHGNLIDDARKTFFLDVVKILATHQIQALVMIADTKCAKATWAQTSELDVTVMFLERIGKHLTVEMPGLVIADRPGGDRKNEDKFISDCIAELKQNNNFAQSESISLILTTNSRLTRLLQAADLITSACLSFVAGEKRYSPPIFEAIKPLLRKGDMGRVGGYGVKIHPDMKYTNLYHWLFGDTNYRKGSLGVALPDTGCPYFSGPDQY